MRLNARRYLPIVLCMFAVGNYSVSAQYHIYWGDVHGHTSLSDGKGSLDDFFTYARDAAKLDFVIVTDHDFGNASPWWMPREKWKLTQDTADKYTVNGKFVAIAGYEWTSQPKYWTDVGETVVSERLFPGPPKFYNHKNVYFPSRVDYIFCAKDPAYMSPDLLAEAVQKHGGLIHNAHPTAGPEGRDQFDYSFSRYAVISNTEVGADTIRYDGKIYQVNSESIVRDFLNGGGKTGFVKGTDTHEGKSAARTAVLARELSREAIFEALRNRRNYAVSNARIVLEFKINEHEMGEEIQIEDKPHIVVSVKGTNKISEVAIVRNGAIAHSINPGEDEVSFEYMDNSFEGNSYYYVRVTQVDTDEHGNRSFAWSSPIWVKRK